MAYTDRPAASVHGGHTHDEAFFRNVAFVGKKIKVTWNPQPIGSYERRGRTYSVGDVTLIVDEDGREIVRRLGRGARAKP